LDRHYNNRAATITKAMAQEYFSIMPPVKENVIVLPPAEAMSASMDALQVPADAVTSRSVNPV